MNRSALVIKMLNYLYANGRKTPVRREVLADVLETNVRNIVEFKKELETAGYVIESIRGKDGGYLLCENGIFPSIALDDKEKEAIHKVVDYLKYQSNFDKIVEFESAINKLKARTISTSSKQDTIYLEDNKTRLNKVEKQMLELLQKAKEMQYEVLLEYKSNIQNSFIERRLQPYEIIVNSDGYYVLAEDITPKKEHKMKVFKITEERMRFTKMLGQKFYRDETFKVSQYIGEYSLMKDEYEISLKISGLAARLINEQEIENTTSKYWEKDDLYITFVMEGKYRVMNFILSLGSQCEVLSPSSIREDIKTELKKVIEIYEK